MIVYSGFGVYRAIDNFHLLLLFLLFLHISPISRTSRHRGWRHSQIKIRTAVHHVVPKNRKTTKRRKIPSAYNTFFSPLPPVELGRFTARRGSVCLCNVFSNTHDIRMKLYESSNPPAVAVAVATSVCSLHCELPVVYMSNNNKPGMKYMTKNDRIVGDKTGNNDKN